MSRTEFLNELREKLVGLPKDDIDDRINFYDEMISDIMDDGKTEEEAVAEIGTVDKVIYDIAQETPLAKLVKEKMKPKRKLKTWEIVLITACSPIWVPLALVAFILCLVAYLLIWILVAVCYSVELALTAGSTAGAIVFAAYLSQGQFNLAALGASIMCAGGAILLFFGCVGATKLTLRLSKFIITRIKTLFIRKGDKK